MQADISAEVTAATPKTTPKAGGRVALGGQVDGHGDPCQRPPSAHESSGNNRHRHVSMSDPLGGLPAPPLQPLLGVVALQLLDQPAQGEQSGTQGAAIGR